MKYLFVGLLCLGMTITGNPLLAERPWAEAMQAFEAADLQSPPTPGGVVFVGSSSIRMWDLDRWFPRLAGPVLNRGFGGSQIDDSVRDIELLVLRHKPRAVVLYAGDNDIAEGKSPERVEEDFRRFVGAVRAELPQVPILFIAIKPSLARWEMAPPMREANALIRAICSDEPSLEFLDVWTSMLDAEGHPSPELFVEDGLHMSDAGYKLWSDLVRSALEAP